MKPVQFPAKKNIIHYITRPLAWCYVTDKGKRLSKYDKNVLITTLVQSCTVCCPVFVHFSLKSLYLFVCETNIYEISFKDTPFNHIKYIKRLAA